MENISKALMIAGGILIVIMVVSLVVVLWHQMSGYFEEQHNATIVEQNAEFNAQFENYNGKSIRGNELISVMNKVVDYNRTYSDMENYDRIIIEIELNGHQSDFKYNSSDNNIISNSSMLSNHAGDNVIENISNLSNKLVSDAKSAGITGINDTKLQKLSASISVIIDDSDDNVDYRKKTIKSILGYEVADPSSMLTNIQNITKQYYQYTQFKRAMFKCTGIEHNTTNGRVNKITFEIEEDASGNIKYN